MCVCCRRIPSHMFPNSWYTLSFLSVVFMYSYLLLYEVTRKAASALYLTGFYILLESVIFLFDF